MPKKPPSRYKSKYKSLEELMEANRRRTWRADLPRQMEGARRKYFNLIRTLKREGMEHLLTKEEKLLG